MTKTALFKRTILNPSTTENGLHIQCIGLYSYFGFDAVKSEALSFCEIIEDRFNVVFILYPDDAWLAISLESDYDNAHLIKKEGCDGMLYYFVDDSVDDPETPLVNPFPDPLGELDPEEPIYGEIESVSVCEDIVHVLLHTDTGRVPLVLSLSDYQRCGISLQEIIPGRKIYYERPINFIDLI